MDLSLDKGENPRRWFARALAALVLGVGFTVGAVGAWTYHHQRELVTRRTLDTLATKACYEGRVLAMWSQRCAVGVEALRQTPGLGAHLDGTGPFPGQTFQAAMEAGGFDAASITDITGRPIPGTVRGDLALVREGGRLPGPPRVGATPAFQLVAPEGEAPFAVCWVSVPPAGGNRARPFLVRVACSREPFQSSSLRIWTYYGSETVELCQRDPRGILLLRIAPQPFARSVVPARPDRAASLAVSGEILQGAENGAGGRRQLFATFFEPATGWGVIARMDAAEALETLRPTFLLLGGLELALLLLVGAGLLLLARRRHMSLLARSHATLESLLGQLLRAQERERSAIAADLHDGVAPILQAAEAHAVCAERGPGPQEMRDSARKARLRIGDASRATRALIAGLVPQALRRLGLAAALKDLAAAGIAPPEIRLHLPGGPTADTLPPETREHLFRISQEAIGNARKHSGASVITLSLEVREGALHLEAADDGRGFADHPENPLAGHFGLGIMEKRARDIGATFAVDTGPGGTRVRVRLPLRGRGGTIPKGDP